jgi:hypothetical protein
MKQSNVVSCFLAPTNENATEAIHPTVGSLHNPAASLGTHVSFDFLGLFTTTMDVPNETKLVDEFPNLVIVIALIHAHSLGLFTCRRGPFDGNTGQRLLDHFHVVAIGPVDGHPHGDAVGLDQQASFDSLLGSVGGIFSGLFPPQGVPWSCTHPCSAKTSRYLAIPDRPVSPTPITHEKRPPRPKVESDHAPWNLGKSEWHPEPSTGNLFEAQRESLPYKPGLEYGVALHRNDEDCGVWEGIVGWPPTNRRESSSFQVTDEHPCR